ncbi:MAG TPA: HIT domain-containing protein [Thermoanaerobaculia bacterium]
MSDCVFCGDPSRAGEIVFENDVAWVIVHPDWACRGHVMVAAREHVENIAQLSDWASFAAIYARAERVLLELTRTDRAIVLKLGIATPHLHLHVYPVSAELDRNAVMRIINAEVRVERDDALVAAMRSAMTDVAP